MCATAKQSSCERRPGHACLGERPGPHVLRKTQAGESSPGLLVTGDSEMRTTHMNTPPATVSTAVLTAVSTVDRARAAARYVAAKIDDIAYRGQLGPTSEQEWRKFRPRR